MRGDGTTPARHFPDALPKAPPGCKPCALCGRSFTARSPGELRTKKYCSRECGGRARKGQNNPIHNRYVVRIRTMKEQERQNAERESRRLREKAKPKKSDYETVLESLGQGVRQAEARQEGKQGAKAAGRLVKLRI